MSFVDSLELVEAESVSALDTKLAEDVSELLVARAAIGDVHIAVSGGSFAQRALPEIVAVATAAGVDWARVHVWFADERFVAADSPDRSLLLVRDALATAPGFVSDHLHAVASADSAVNVHEAATRYAEVLHATVTRTHAGAPALDCILLGMGPDGHTASLFPGMLPTESECTAAVTDSPKPPSERVTLTFGTLAAADHCWIYATGSSKQEALTTVASNPSVDACPITGVRAQQSVRLYADTAAIPEDLRTATKFIQN